MRRHLTTPIHAHQGFKGRPCSCGKELQSCIRLKEESTKKKKTSEQGLTNQLLTNYIADTAVIIVFSTPASSMSLRSDTFDSTNG